MPFTVIATYRSETRKLAFLNVIPFLHSTNFTTRVFPISHSIILSKLLFSPDASARVLLSREVRNAAEYDLAVAPFKGRAWMGPSLRVSVSDETLHKLPSSPQPQASNPQKPVVSNPFPVVEPSFGKPETNDPPTVPQHDIASCCAIAQTRKDLPKIPLQVPPSNVPELSSTLSLPSVPMYPPLCQYNLCWRCGVIKQGPWFNCSTCNNKLCVTCLETTSISDCFFGSPHVWKKQTCSYCAPNSSPTLTPSPLQPTSWGSVPLTFGSLSLPSVPAIAPVLREDSACEALPIAVHPATHPLLKLKDVGTALSTVYCNNVGESRLPANDIATSASGCSPIKAAPASLRAPSPAGSYGSGCLRNPAAGTYGIPSPEAQPPSPFYFRSESARSQTPESEVENTSLPAPAPVRNFSPVPPRSPSPTMMIPGALQSPAHRIFIVVDYVADFSPYYSSPYLKPRSPFVIPGEYMFESQRAPARSPSPEHTCDYPEIRHLMDDEPSFSRDLRRSMVQSTGSGIPAEESSIVGGSYWYTLRPRASAMAGADLGRKPQSVGVVQPNEQIELWPTGELKAPENLGRYVAYYRLRYVEGNLFGHSIWLDITVSEAFQRDSPEILASSDYLSSSSIVIMPTAAPTPSSAVANSDANGNGAPEGLHRNSSISDSHKCFDRRHD
ncbi:uncharacterized protein C8R40DRAFT_1172488 [Lentinula edodes]|uniref:uncharacterized protein n=1 Tax=Lentinula edodes TaxID=5353 RepID=UPI001E8D2873|nr:uncharacterized protein C8R40DRAFT_1172488 [Lentinula edodes]KAH7873691.1 hypothetical protein C8R40DRAFT_1172488 [Lentinula edodes]